jgi:S1-C subfamily serine protease
LIILGVIILSSGLVATVFTWALSKMNVLSSSGNGASSPSAETVSLKLPNIAKFNSQDQSQNQANDDSQNRVANATVCVRGTLPNGQEVCASGVSIDPAIAGIDPDDGSVVVTNFHVVFDTGDNPPVQVANDDEWYTAEVIRRSPEMDLALLLVPDASFPTAPLAETSPDEEIEVRAIGFPNNQALTVTDSRLLGKINTCLAISPCLAMEQGTITNGNSGGPLEADGQVIGINQGETTDEIAIPVEQVHQFLSGEIPDFANLPPQYNPGYPPGVYPFPPPPMGGGFPPPGRRLMPYPPPPMGGPPGMWQ